MAPGLTSKGGDLSVDVESEKFVAVMAEGKEEAVAIGQTKMSTKEMKEIKKNTAVTNLHYLNDGLWSTMQIEA